MQKGKIFSREIKKSQMCEQVQVLAVLLCIAMQVTCFAFPAQIAC